MTMADAPSPSQPTESSPVHLPRLSYALLDDIEDREKPQCVTSTLRSRSGEGRSELEGRRWE